MNPTSAQLYAHESIIEGLRAGLEATDSVVTLATDGGGPNPSLFAALIELPDGRVLTPGLCVMRSFGLGADVDEAVRSTNTLLIRSLFGLLGDDLRAALE